MRKTLVLFLTAVAFCAQNAGAQVAPSDAPSEAWHSKLSFGLRTGIRFLNPIDSVEATDSTTATDPPQTTTISSDSATKRFPVGLTMHVQFTDRWGLTFDALYSRAGYDASSKTETQPEGDENPDFVSALYERTRADYWDFPILARYYYTGFQDDPARLFIAAGVAARTVSGIHTFSENFVEENKRSNTSAAPVRPDNRAVLGAVVGGGLRLLDEVGLKVDMEVRYTRWIQRVFDSSVARSSQNEGAVYIGFSF